MLDGVKIMVGGEEMTLPHLNWRSVKRFFKDITGGALDDPDRAIDLMPEMLLEALVRNYPEITQAELEDRMTPGEMLAAIPKLLEVSGFTRVAAGEA